MAALTLSVLHPLISTLRSASRSRVINRLLRESHLTTCYWSSEFVLDCRQLATIHHLESGLEFCSRHFALIEKEKAKL